MQRIDAGSSLGAGITLARGYNTLTWDLGITSTALKMTNISGLFFMNYFSGKYVEGDGAHNHTVIFSGANMSSGPATGEYQITSVAPVIPETDYWLGNIGYRIPFMSRAAGAAGITLSAEVKAGEGSSLGWRDLYADNYVSDIENGLSILYVRARSDFKRYPQDPDTDRMDPEGSRQYRIFASTAINHSGLDIYCTYHGITYAIAGNTTGSAGGLISLNAYRSDNGEKINSTSRTGNGAYSMVWYDNTVNVFTEARESSVLIGRSDSTLAA